ncbi:MAG: TIGR02099 family protein [Betaproteobacteria bacterium]|nr:TIGR02099 family protein [Betaproteobacteria bacterium]
MPAFSIFRWLHLSSLWVYRAVTWTVILCAFVSALVVGGVRFWLLPNIESYREAIAREISSAAKQRIAIGWIEGRWSGFNLQLTLGDVAVFDRAGQPALKLERVDSTLSWWSLVLWEPRFDLIEIEQPDLNIKRDKDGVVWVAGIELTGSTDSGGLSDWLLRQEEIVIRDAAIVWRDELREAPELALRRVSLRLENDGRRHSFGLRASPPENIASPLDLRGDFTGRTITDLAHWNGQLFAQLDYTDIAAWRTWVPFPVSFPNGAGAVRAWAGLRNGQLSNITADVRLSNARTRLGKDLPELELEALQGRVGWKQFSDGFEISTSRLGVTTRAYTLQPMDLLLRYSDGSEGRPPSGELRANVLALEPLMALADHFPFERELREEIDRYAPRGDVHDALVKWTGSWPRPAQYSVKGRFADLGLKAVGRIPGFAGVSGDIDGTERGGTLHLSTQKAAVDLPRVFRDKLAFDALTAQLAWQRNGEQYNLKLNSISFSNPDFAGSVFGTYHTAPDGPGVIDLTGNVTRAEARSVARYVPLQVGERARQWLHTSLLAGASNDVKVRLKGNLANFPFAEGRGGVFQVTAQVTGGVVDYADGWPKIENIEGSLTFRGKSMDISVRDASILGAKLARVRAELPDLAATNRVLTVNGEAEGPTSEFLKFIEHSPLFAMIDRFTESVRADGRGRLALKLTIPFTNTKDTRVTGAYQFVNNRIQSEGDLFPLEQVNGRLEFTETDVYVPGAAMTVLGGPATLASATQRDGTVRFAMSGRMNVESFLRSSTAPWAGALRGASDWTAVMTLRNRVADIVFDSTLEGIASTLPAPLAKAAADSMPLKLERRVTGARQDRIAISLDNVFAAQLQRRREGGNDVIERGTVSLGGTAAVPERKGVWVTGGLKSLDLDQWSALLKSIPATGNRIELAGLDVKFGTLDAFGRRFNDLAITASAQGGVWQSVLAGRELTGEVAWRPEGRGKVTARMKNLVIPAATPDRSAPVADKEQPNELPALDIVAEKFQVRQASLGRLEVTALPEGRDWKLERLRVTNPDATLNIEGLWQGWLTQPRTQVNVKLETSDIGRLLVRLGYPEGIKRGTARLEGPLTWAGIPSEIDYPSLSGNFVVEAHKGQFAKLDPGIGKLLGVLSLQSLPRRLTLDFRDIFSDGLAFDEIVGTVKVTRGVATTENFRIQGPAVRVQMSGDVDLSAETQKLRVKVFPSFSDSLSVAGALLGGPVAGIASFLVQKMLKDPFDQMVAYEYGVTGTWADPQVSKIESGPAPAAEQPR